MRPLPCCAGEPGGTGVGPGEGGPGLTAALLRPGATKDVGKMLGGDEEKDPGAAKREEERREALRQEEAERKAKCARMEAEREAVRQGIRDKYGIKKKEEREAEAQAAMEANSEGSLTRPKKAIPPGCGDEPEEEEESILDTVIKYLPGPLQDIFKK
ncbi:complexin-1 isoform 1-T1 [Megaptera novaeangliae]